MPEKIIQIHYSNSTRVKINSHILNKIIITTEAAGKDSSLCSE
jgi:hypothetical protein